MIRFYILLTMFFTTIALGENTTVLLQGNFADNNFLGQWELQAPAEVEKGVLKTVGKLSIDSALASSQKEFYIPGCDDDYLLQAQWEFTATGKGERGQGFGFEGCGFFVSTFWLRPMLNDEFYGLEELQLNKRYKMSCVFNRFEVFSWKIDGVEQLKAPVKAFRAGGKKSVARMQDFWDVDSKTDWHCVRISKVPPEDILAIKLGGFYEQNNSLKSKPVSFILGNATAMDKVFKPVSEYCGKVGDIVNVSAAGRERESFQIVVMPLSKSLQNVEVEVTDLLHDDGKTHFSSQNISWSPVGYVKTKKSNSAYQGIGKNWPDILLPSKPFDVKLGEVQPIWFTVHVPADIKNGKYRGLINVKPQGESPRLAKIELTVQPYSLSLRGKLKTAFSFSPDYWEKWYCPDKTETRFDEYAAGSVLPRQAWLRLYDLMLANRLSPTNIYNRYRVFPFREDMEYCYKRGMNATCLFMFNKLPEDEKHADRYLAGVQEYLKDWEKFIKKKNWQDMTWYVHGFDESEMRPDRRKYDNSVKKTFGMLGEKFPWLKRETANPIIPRYYDLVDIWTPVSRQFTPDQLPEYYRRQEKGDELWTYVCCGPRRPFANFFLDCPGVDPRILGWQLFQYHISGFLYYQIDQYTGQKNWNRDAPKWPDEPWNTLSFGVSNDGILIYPGRDMVPLASTRLANVRDGIEDYEALAILSDLSEKLKKKGGAEELVKKIEAVTKVRPEISKSFTEYTKEPRLILNARREVDLLITKAMSELKRQSF